MRDTCITQKYKKKCGLERPISQKAPDNKKLDHNSQNLANTAVKRDPEASATESEADPGEATRPPLPPSAAPVTASAETDLLFEETDMDELDWMDW